MNRDLGLAVTLSPELHAQLKVEAEKLGLPIAWLVASLVVDTIESAKAEHRTHVPAA